MSPNVRFSLSAQILERGDGLAPRIWAAVHVMVDGVVGETIDVIDHEELAIPAQAPLSSAENFASCVVRAMARMLDDVQLERLRNGQVHPRSDLAVKYEHGVARG